MSSSYMDETNPVSGEETFMASGKILMPTKTSPFHVTPLGITLSLRYNALADIRSSRSPPSSSMWSHSVASTSEPFTPQIHNVTITYVPMIPTFYVASSAPIVSAVIVSSVVTIVARPSVGPTSGGPSASTSGVVNLASSVPPSSGSFPAGWTYVQYM